MWFDKGELSKVDRIVEPVFFEIRHLPKKAEQLKALNCPVCGNMQILRKAEHPRDNKVILDYCPSCKGIWLDKNELEAIQKETWIVTIKNLFRNLTSTKD
jgi:Zn-finger nucleic acid-binding protein